MKSFSVVFTVEKGTMPVNLINTWQQIILPVEVFIDCSLDDSFCPAIHLRCMRICKVVHDIQFQAGFVEVEKILRTIISLYCLHLKWEIGKKSL